MGFFCHEYYTGVACVRTAFDSDDTDGWIGISLQSNGQNRRGACACGIFQEIWLFLNGWWF